MFCVDDGDPPKTATATLTVTVEDINDNAPRFLKDYRPVLPEHSAPRKVKNFPPDFIRVLVCESDPGSRYIFMQIPYQDSTFLK